MLTRLLIQNYALIDALALQPGPQLNLITGETGAGKSIMLGALGLILGERADTAVVLDTARKCVVEAYFRLPDESPVWAAMAEADLDREGNELILRRELSPQGKSRAFVNDTPATLPVLKALASQLVDLHSQRDGQRLLDEREQLNMLDQYAGTQAQVAAFGQALRAIQAHERQLAQLQAEHLRASQEADYRHHQLDELSQAQLQAGEDEALEQELRSLQHYEALTQGMGETLSVLSESETAVLQLLARQRRVLERLASLHPALPGLLDQLAEAQVLLQDASHTLSHELDQLERDPQRQAELEARHDLYTRLKLKYKVAVAADLIALRDQLALQLGAYQDSDRQQAELKALIEAGYQQLAQLAQALEEARQVAAVRLAQQVNAQLEAVALPHAEFAIELTRLTQPDGPLKLGDDYLQPQPNGIHRLSFRIRTNAGVPMGPLNQVASGGELARVMLALKAALAEHTDLPLLIFDEIDTGISGEVALRVGRVIQQLALRHQLIVITHLPQIASRPATHYYIYKDVMNGKTNTRIRPLLAAERVQEVARIMAGDNPSPAALASAEELMR